MKKTVLLLLFLLFLLLPAACTADHAKTAYYRSEQTGELLEYPFEWMNYELNEDGTVTISLLTLPELAAKEMNGTFYLPAKVDDYIVTGFASTLFEYIDLKGFTRVVIPETVTSYTVLDEYSVNGFLIDSNIREVVFEGNNPAFTLTEDGCILHENRLAGLINNEGRIALVIPEGVQVFDLSLIAETCPGLLSLTLPASLEIMECTQNLYPLYLEKIEVHPDNPVFHDTDGVLFKGTDLFLYPAGYPADHYFVPEGTKTISALSFFQCDRLKAVTLPESLEHLYSYAFYACRAMRSINIPAGLSQIDEGAIGFCWSLNDILLSPENPVYTLENNLLIDRNQNILLVAAGNGESRIVVPASIRTIGACAFTNHFSMTQTVLNEGLEVIGEEAFCFTELTDIRLPDSLTTISANAFYGCEELIEVAFAGNAAALKNIGESAFSDTALTAFHFPQDCPLEVLEDDVFAHCQSLETVTLPTNLQEIGAYAFYDCKSLRKLNLPDTVHTLGDSFMLSCPALRSLKLPQALRELDVSQLYQMGNLEYLIIPSHLSLPSFLPGEFKQENLSGHGRLVVYPGSNAHKACKKQKVPYTLVEDLPFCLGTLQIISSSDEALQRFLDEGGVMSLQYKDGQLNVIARTADGDESIRLYPCEIANGKIRFGTQGYLLYNSQDITHVELLSNQWTMKLKGEELP